MTARPLKIALIGAGSVVFTRKLVGDILSYPALSHCEIALHDIDQKRLTLAQKVTERMAATLGVCPTITAHSDRIAAITSASYVINTIQVGGYRPATVIDFEIPKQFGVAQTIGDTLGIGGIMRALRTIPVMQEMVREMEIYAPNALHLNYVNPMAMITWALNKTSRQIQTVGLCHSVQYTAAELAEDLQLPVSEIAYRCAGINHLSFYLNFEHQGLSLYPALREVISAGRVPDWNRVRYEIFQRFGYFPTESSEHLSEYLPWFIKPSRPDLLEKFNIPLDEYPGRCEVFEKAWPYIERELTTPGSEDPEAMKKEIEEANICVMRRNIDKAPQMLTGLREFTRSIEFGASIIHAQETGVPQVINGNVQNQGFIDNLPEDCVVEVPCLVDHNGVQPTRVGALPLQLAALMRTQINVQELVVASVLEEKREHVYHAALLDPHTSSVLDIEQTYALVDALLVAHRAYLPAYLQT